MIRRAFLAAVAALAAFPCIASTEVVASGSDDALTWRIERDPAIAAAAPGLAAFLDAESRDRVAGARAEAEQARDDALAAGHPWRPHELILVDEARAIVPGFVSVLRTTYRYQGGAHGGAWFDPLVWDLVAADPVLLDRFLPPTAAGAKGLNALVRRVRDELKSREGLWPKAIAMATQPDPVALQFYTLEPSTERGKIGGVAFHFAPYEVGPYALGPQHVVVPWGAFAEGLAPDVQALFGGRPVQ